MISGSWLMRSRYARDADIIDLTSIAPVFHGSRSGAPMAGPNGNGWGRLAGGDRYRRTARLAPGAVHWSEFRRSGQKNLHFRPSLPIGVPTFTG
jgi:hypothetical protein